MQLRINRGIANGRSYCHWSIDSGEIFEGGIYHDKEWSAIFGKTVIVLDVEGNSVQIHFGPSSKPFEFAKVYLFVNKPPEVIHEELTNIRKQVLAWFNTIDRHEDFVIDLDSEILF